ncbi:CaiB/BaiF CoA transferase family protein [Paraliomyxa miuraensis]|uniref:CaiB/BaiF CoA transferase family protein n=1 Tax=Paraliomyxa miuraensis TaxID=376150 RepID=UPI00224FD45D|nr:CaiB/BaiF CoA-transferase family protein [Paraliomyxa miuraensis]MCX4241072.1 CoA transferase [Paraliomyxa miuraensis]
MSSAPAPEALAGLRVLELGQLLAGPFAGFLLAGFGAEVIKVEPPGTGDAIRKWRKLEGGTSLWWRSLARGKRSITCDLRKPAGRDLLRRLLATGIDVVIENFRPGRMEAWGLGYEELRAIDPRIIMVRVSGYGQTGPYRDRPGFANVAEAFGGLRYVSGFPDRPPVRTGASLGDSLAGLHAAFATLAAVHERDRADGGSGQGQQIDVALYESVFSIMESLVPEYDRLGHVRERTGSALPGIVPSNTYRCADGRYVVIGANSDGLYRKLMHAIGRPRLADDPRMQHNDGRSAHADELDAAIEAWTSSLPQAQVLEALVRADVPSGPINSAADLFADPHVAARDMLEPITLPDGSTLRVPRITPLLSRTPARSHFAGPELGAHNEEIYVERLGLTPDELDALRAQGVV